MVQLAIDKENDTCKRYLLLQGLYVPSVKTTIYICNRFNTSFCTRDHKTHWTISCYTLLHQATRDEGKNSLRKRRNILVSDRDFATIFCYYNNLILIYDALSTYRLYYVQFKEVKILWGSGAGYEGQGPGAG